MTQRKSLPRWYTSGFHKARLIAGAALALFLVPAASGATLNLSTGFDASGNLITTDLGCDAHWVQTAGPPPACPGSAAQVDMPGDTDFPAPGAWVANNASSEWITSNASTVHNGAPLPTYELTFFLTDTAGASLSGSWTIDDAGTISLNGNSIGSLPVGNWTSLHSVSTSSGFLVGANTLSIRMTFSDNLTEGVRFQGSVNGTGASFTPAGPTVPEPASGMLLLAGAAAIFGYRRFRKV